MVVYDQAQSSRYLEECVQFMLQTQNRKYKRLMEKAEKRWSAKGNPLMDTEKKAHVYVLTTERDSVDRIKALLEQEKDEEIGCVLVLLDCYSDSRITPKYVKRRIEMGSQKVRIDEVIGVEHNEGDTIARREAAYEERIELKAHSRQWMKMVLQLSHLAKSTWTESSGEEVGIDADSYLVRS